MPLHGPRDKIKVPDHVVKGSNHHKIKIQIRQISKADYTVEV